MDPPEIISGESMTTPSAPETRISKETLSSVAPGAKVRFQSALAGWMPSAEVALSLTHPVSSLPLIGQTTPPGSSWAATFGIIKGDARLMSISITRPVACRRTPPCGASCRPSMHNLAFLTGIRGRFACSNKIVELHSIIPTSEGGLRRRLAPNGWSRSVLGWRWVNRLR